jgi:hypothetical protein
MRRPLRDFTVGERLLTWGTCVIVLSDKLEVVPTLTVNPGRLSFGEAYLYVIHYLPDDLNKMQLYNTSVDTMRKDVLILGQHGSLDRIPATTQLKALEES